MIEKKIIDGVTFVTIKNNKEMLVELCSFGASFHDIKTLDKNNNLSSVLLTPSDLSEFYYNTGYHGKIVGRFSGRIDKGVCTIDGKEYKLDMNWNGLNSLHGGFKGISFANFETEVVENAESYDVIFTYLEKENMLPGDVCYKITYKVLKDENDIVLLMEATTNKETVVNLTNHAYFNLSGDKDRDILDHKMQFLCDKYTRLNNELITITVDKVNEVMDFQTMHEVGKYIYDSSLQDHIAKGYDHCFIKKDVSEPLVAVLYDDVTGRKLSVSTSYPAVVCYSGCYPSSAPFNDERFKIRQYHSVCLECQYVPNGINMDDVDKAILKPNETYSHYIKYHFDVE